MHLKCCRGTLIPEAWVRVVSGGLSHSSEARASHQSWADGLLQEQTEELHICTQNGPLESLMKYYSILLVCICMICVSCMQYMYASVTIFQDTNIDVRQGRTQSHRCITSTSRVHVSTMWQAERVSAPD